MSKLTLLQFVFLIVFIFIAALLSSGQAVTFAWLSSFPEQSTRLDILRFKFWLYAFIALTFLLVDLILISYFINRINKK